VSLASKYATFSALNKIHIKALTYFDEVGENRFMKKVTKTIISFVLILSLSITIMSVYALARNNNSNNNNNNDNSPSYSNPQTLTCTVDEIRAMLYTYSPDTFSLLDNLITTERRNVPIVETARNSPDFVDPRTIPFDARRRHELTVNEFIAHYGRSNRLFFSVRSVAHYTKHHFQFSGRDNVNRNSNSLSYLFLVDGEVVDVQVRPSMQQLVHTSASTGRLPNELQSLHWDFYVTPDVYAVSNIVSVYGLLVEYAAFLFEYKVLNDMTDYVLQHLDIYGFNTRLVQNFLSNLSRQPFFYEFTFWILHHLIFLQENHPQQFRTIMDNEEFVKVFAYVYQSFSELVYETAPDNLITVLEKITELDGSYHIEDYTITITCRNYRSSIFWIASRANRINGSGLVRIMEELETPRYVEMLENLLSRAGRPENRTSDRGIFLERVSR
jgi:hypothetical protein